LKTEKKRKVEKLKRTCPPQSEQRPNHLCRYVIGLVEIASGNLRKRQHRRNSEFLGQVNVQVKARPLNDTFESLTKL
jgi:hypothetical protein